MVALASGGLTTVAARSTWKLPAVQDFGTRRLRVEPSMQTPAMELSLLPIGGGFAARASHYRFMTPQSADAPRWREL